MQTCSEIPQSLTGFFKNLVNFLNFLFVFLFSNKMLVLRARIDKRDLKTANREDPALFVYAVLVGK